jgi:hypothetical protein
MNNFGEIMDRWADITFPIYISFYALCAKMNKVLFLHRMQNY